MERVRRIVRRLAGPDSWIYSTAAAVLSGTAAAWREGPRRASQLRRLSRAGAGPPEPLQFRNLAHPIFVRPGTPDITTVVNNIVREEYGRYRPAREPLAMIDAGGYIGDSSAYFLSRYPGLRVATLEPDRDNFELAERNLAPYGERARLMNAALFSAPGVVRIAGSHDGAFVSASGVEVQAMSVPEVMTRMNWERLDILKMDIEGAEADVLGPSAGAWLGNVDMLIVELHGADASRTVVDTMARNHFVARQYRSLWYFNRRA